MINLSGKSPILPDYKKCSDCDQILTTHKFLDKDHYFYCDICEREG